MDELTLLRRTRDDELTPTPQALSDGRAALLARTQQTDAAGSRHRAPRSRRRWKWAIAIPAVPATLAIGVLVAGSVSMSAQSAHAAGILRSAAVEAVRFADPAPLPGQYVLSHTYADWSWCLPDECMPNVQVIDVYMPADPDAEWVLHRQFLEGYPEGPTEQTWRAVDGAFYYDSGPWKGVDVNAIPTDGETAYAWIDAQYQGGSSSRDEDNFVRITDILRTGLIPAAQRAALLDALARIPGVTATEGVTNLDGVEGIAIGRTEPLRFGQRDEIIIDPATGALLGERMVSTQSVFGWGVDEVITQTAITTSIVDSAP